MDVDYVSERNILLLRHMNNSDTLMLIIMYRANVEKCSKLIYSDRALNDIPFFSCRQGSS